MSFDLDLAIVYVCALVLGYWLASWLLPALLEALVTALRAGWRRIHIGFSNGMRSSLPQHFPDVRVRGLFDGYSQ